MDTTSVKRLETQESVKQECAKVEGIQEECAKEECAKEECAQDEIVTEKECFIESQSTKERLLFFKRMSSSRFSIRDNSTRSIVDIEELENREQRYSS